MDLLDGLVARRGVTRRRDRKLRQRRIFSLRLCVLCDHFSLLLLLSELTAPTVTLFHLLSFKLWASL